MSAFEALTCLDASDLYAHAISFAASEYAHEDDNPEIGAKIFEVARTLRRLEDAEMDGQSAPLLGNLRKLASTPDTYEGECRAHYLLRAEFKRLASL